MHPGPRGLRGRIVRRGLAFHRRVGGEDHLAHPLGQTLGKTIQAQLDRRESGSGLKAVVAVAIPERPGPASGSGGSRPVDALSNSP